MSLSIAPIAGPRPLPPPAPKHHGLTPSAKSPCWPKPSALILGAAFSILTPKLWANEVSPFLPLWEAGAGAAALSLPHYRGSSQSKSWILPLPYFTYRGDVFRADRKGVRAQLSHGQDLDLDLAASASPPVTSKETEARRGMRDIPATVEIGPRINWTIHQERRQGHDKGLHIRAPIRWVFCLSGGLRACGLTLEPALGLDIKTGQQNLGLSTGPLWANQQRHDLLYSVDPADAQVGRPSFRASGGYSGWQTTISSSYRNDQFWIAGYTRYDQIAGSISSSPLITTKNNISFGFALGWTLLESDTPSQWPKHNLQPHD
jgi:outer membrane protein